MNYALPPVAPAKVHRPDSIANSALAAADPGRDDLVQLLYQGPLEEGGWGRFLAALLACVPAQQAGISISHHGRQIVHHVEARDPVRRLRAESAGLWQYRPDGLFCQRHAIYHALHPDMHPDMHPGKVWQLAARHGDGWEVRLTMVAPASCPASCPVPCPVSCHEQLREHWLAGLEPHLAQALALYVRLNAGQAMCAVLADALDQMVVGSFILDADGVVLHGNKAACGLIDAGLMLSGADGVLALAGQAQNRAFHALIANAASGKIAPLGEVMAVDAGRGVRFGLLVRRAAGEGHGGNGVPAVIVHVSGSGAARPVEQHVRQLFGLKPYEAQLAALLTTGFSLMEAADKLGLTENTVRTYCKTILSKVGVRRQSELVCTILRSVAVLG